MRKGSRVPDGRRQIRSQRYSDIEALELLAAAGDDSRVNAHIRAAALLVAAVRPPGAKYATVDRRSGQLQFFEERPLIPGLVVVEL